LGRTVATFGFLEEVLGKAIFAFTATRRYKTAEEVRTAYEAWLPQLQRALTDQLWKLSETYGKAVRSNSDSIIGNTNELVEDIKAAAKIRNVLCHCSWRIPDENGKSLPLFINQNHEKFDTLIDIAFLEQVQQHVNELACCVIDSVTHMGWRFPGGAGPGETIWPQS
jgi:hypothetical protein